MIVFGKKRMREEYNVQLDEYIGELDQYNTQSEEYKGELDEYNA